jgi:hypothetical protein
VFVGELSVVVFACTCELSVVVFACTCELSVEEFVTFIASHLTDKIPHTKANMHNAALFIVFHYDTSIAPL